MGNNRSPAIRRRPWRLLSLVLLWARKGGAFKHRHFFDPRLLPAYIRNLRRADAADRLRYGERQLSLDETPAFHFRIHRPAALRLPRLPCITPPADFDDDERIFSERKLLRAGACAAESHGDARGPWGSPEEDEDAEEEEEDEDGEQEIDSRAERFIVEFYEQMKLQRQISYLEYSEMLRRGT